MPVTGDGGGWCGGGGDFAVGFTVGLVGEVCGFVWGLVCGLVCGFVWGLVCGLVCGFLWGLACGFALRSTASNNSEFQGLSGELSAGLMEVMTCLRLVHA